MISMAEISRNALREMGREDLRDLVREQEDGMPRVNLIAISNSPASDRNLMTKAFVLGHQGLGHKVETWYLDGKMFYCCDECDIHSYFDRRCPHDKDGVL